MEISYLDLLCCFLVYSFLGWIFETLVTFLRNKTISNRGFFSLPFCPAYGIIVDFLIILYSRVGTTDYILKYIMALVVSGVGLFLAGAITELLTGHTMWDYRKDSVFSGEKWPLIFGLIEGLIFMTAETLIQPWLSLLLHYVPHTVKLIVCAVFCGALALDFIFIEVALRKKRSPGEIDKFLSKTGTEKNNLEQFISGIVWRRLTKAYPELKTEPNAKLPRFAQGVCFNKLVWVFLIASLVGDLIETCYVRYTGGVWMSRSSLIYGPFSVVWGFGAVLLTLILHPLAKKKDFFIFVGGFFIGGIYEYSCSVLTEVFLHTTFWDYSNMPFNIGGRTNLLYCFFWGLLGLIWLRLCYPPLSDLIEKIPTYIGTILTWVILIAFLIDGLLSAAILIRYSDRQKDATAHNGFETFLDQNYPDSLVEKRWQNMKLGGVGSSSSSSDGSGSSTDNDSGSSDSQNTDGPDMATPSSADKTGEVSHNYVLVSFPGREDALRLQIMKGNI